MDGLPQLTPHLVGGYEESGGDSKLQFKDDLVQSNKNISEQLLDQRERETRSGEEGRCCTVVTVHQRILYEL
jgi:hypothetical protein